MGTKVGSLKGFGIGDESVENVLVPSQVQTRAANDTCIGCHAATPDGNSVGFTMGPQNYFNQLANVTAGAVGTTPVVRDGGGAGDDADAARHPGLFAGALERRRSRRRC